MPEIKHRQDKASPEIEYAEIYIPDDKHLGTGSFRTVIKPGALSIGKAVSSIMIQVPAFQISVNLNPSTREIPVLLGPANGSEPISRKVFLFSEEVIFTNTHEFEVTFQDWKIMGLSMDRIPLSQQIEGLLPPGAPIPEHLGSMLITFPKHDWSEEVRERILDKIFDLSKYFTFYQIVQGNTEINIYRNTDSQFVFRHYNPTFGEREIRIDFSDAERVGAKAFFLAATWSAEKNTFRVGLIHSDPKFEPLREGFVLSQDRLRVIKEEIEVFEQLVNAAGKEEEAHQFLKNSNILLGLTSSINPISKFKLGDDYITDFVINEVPEGYVLVEIERPTIRMFKKTTPPERTHELNHAIEQIENWRAWVGKNHAYISGKLEGISPNPVCWLIAGRRTNLSPEESRRLAEINQEHRGSYKILTYDDLISRVKNIISKLF